MTKTCATCKYSSVEPMSVPFDSYLYYYFRYAKNVVYPDANIGEKQSLNFDLFTCNHPERFYDDPVSGEKISKGNMCTDLRESGSDFCGPLGRMWETKECSMS